MNRNAKILLYPAVLLFALFLTGCAGTVANMRPVPPDQVVAGPEEGKAKVVFMRPSGFGFAIQSSVFLIKEDTPFLVGIVAAKKKVAYQVDPGKHLFMVVGESGDFMSAELAPNKTYYALVTPRMGMWKARFSLKPLHADDLDSEKFEEWRKACEWVEISPASDEWAAENRESIQSKYDEYFSDWMGKEPSDRPVLLPQDGLYHRYPSAQGRTQ